MAAPGLATEATAQLILDAVSGFPLRLTAVQTPAAAYTAAVGDLVRMNSTAGDVTVRLPTISADNKNGQIGFTFVPIGAGNGANILLAAGNTANGSASIGMDGSTDFTAVIISDGVSNWVTVSFSQIPA